MQRVAFRMRLKPGREAEYKERHDAIWPELAAVIRESGVRNYSIFRIDLDLFAYLEMVDEAPAREPSVPPHPVLQRWWDSMEPLMSSGDRILIDTSQRVPVPPGIFVIWDGMGLVSKRVEHIPNSDPPKVLIKSVNPEYQAYERIAEEVNVVGRVVWAARRL